MAKPVLPTLQQTKFVRELMISGVDATTAARNAGYSESVIKYPSRIMQAEGVKHEIEQAQKKLRAKIAKDYEWKYEKLKRIIAYFVPDEGDLKPDHTKVAITAMSELNKMTGDYAPDKRLQVTVDHTKGKLLEARKQYKEY
jgi:phage terminase small subunit